MKVGLIEILKWFMNINYLKSNTMKNLILSVTLSLMTGFVYSQNCTFGIYLKSYRNTTNKISFLKRKDLTFYIKTDSCTCIGNNFRVFVKNDLKNWGKLVNTEINGTT
jgi:hypothetical protein